MPNSKRIRRLAKLKLGLFVKVEYLNVPKRRGWFAFFPKMKRPPLYLGRNKNQAYESLYKTQRKILFGLIKV
jgi:UDP-N-acetylglucosamine:LPS N-acetylglucosamine transferase